MQRSSTWNNVALKNEIPASIRFLIFTSIPQICKIAVYKDRLAVQLAERVIIYEPIEHNGETMQYRIKNKLGQTLECSLLVVTTNHLVMCLDRRLQSLTFAGVVEREWLLDAPITYIKVVGGPPGSECLITGKSSNWIFMKN